MFDALDIAKYVILMSNSRGKEITNLKLQKMLYYIQGYAMKFCDGPAFPESIRKWPYGPVVPEVYFSYNENGSRSIVEDEEDFGQIIKKLKCDRGLKRVVDQVIDNCQDRKASKLVEMTHQEKPWQNAKDSREIPQDAICSYFNAYDPLKLGEE